MLTARQIQRLNNKQIDALNNLSLSHKNSVKVDCDGRIMVSCLCQHSGNFGPWFHISWYTLTASGKWSFYCHDDSHFNANRAYNMGLPFGRPRTN